MEKHLKFKIRHLICIPVIGLALACGGSGNRSANDSDTTRADIDTVSDNHEWGSNIDPQTPFATEPQNKFAKIVGWKDGEGPVAPEGYSVVKFAANLNSPRNIYVAENGDIFVSQARTEGRDEDAEKVDSRNIFRAKSPNEILRFRDENNDGVADKQEIFLNNLSQPYGMLILGNHFYVANTDAVVRFPYDQKTGKVTNNAQKLISLPAGGYNNHWTRNIIAKGDGSKIYVSVGSASNVGEYGMDKEVRRATILEINPDGSGERIFAAGIRNPVGMDWEPNTSTLWTAVNERDDLGDEVVPDYILSVKENGWYGWPYTYWGKHVDPRWTPNHKESLGTAPDSLTKKSITPDYALGAHTASLGLAFNKTNGFSNGAFIGQHGSWNRSEFVGYKVVFVPFEGGKPSGEPQDFLTGFIADKAAGEVHGRPVAIAFTKDYMLVTDDAANVIWAVIPE